MDGDASKFDKVKEVIIGKRRWSVVYRLIFREKDQPESEAWSTTYSAGATECQDESPFQYQETVECQAVRLEQRTVPAWVDDAGEINSLG